MIKIVSLIPPAGGARTNVMHQFFETLPEGFEEVVNPVEADVFFAHVNFGWQNADIYIEGVDPNMMRFNLSNLNLELLDKLKAITDIPGILFFDGPGRMDVPAYPHFVRDMDIPISPAELPDHPNRYKTHFVDERAFYISHRHKRVPKTLMLLPDHLISPGIPDAMKSILDEGLIDKVTVVGSTTLVEISATYGGDSLFNLERYVESGKIELAPRVGWPTGVRELLNTQSYFLSTCTLQGLELMGVEAGFCGAQPIYPDDAYYEEVFEGTGVQFFDKENRTESLSKILTDFSWDSDAHETFLNKCSGQRNLPAFWEHVRSVLGK